MLKKIIKIEQTSGKKVQAYPFSNFYFALRIFGKNHKTGRHKRRAQEKRIAKCARVDVKTKRIAHKIQQQNAQRRVQSNKSKKNTKNIFWVFLIRGT